jgi:hypothetical protein
MVRTAERARACAKPAETSCGPDSRLRKIMGVVVGTR